MQKHHILLLAALAAGRAVKDSGGDVVFFQILPGTSELLFNKIEQERSQPGGTPESLAVGDPSG